MNVILFARARDVVGRECVTLDLPAGSTVAELRRLLEREFPALARLVGHSAIAVDNDYAADDRRLQGTEEVALLPPVSGG